MALLVAKELLDPLVQLDLLERTALPELTDQPEKQDVPAHLDPTPLTVPAQPER